MPGRTGRPGRSRCRQVVLRESRRRTTGSSSRPSRTAARRPCEHEPGWPTASEILAHLLELLLLVVGQNLVEPGVDLLLQVNQLRLLLGVGFKVTWVATDMIWPGIGIAANPPGPGPLRSRSVFFCASVRTLPSFSSTVFWNGVELLLLCVRQAQHVLQEPGQHLTQGRRTAGARPKPEPKPGGAKPPFTGLT